MGLLDDAIREHLDLKRARGADPAEVERMEREALGPVRREPAIGARQFDAPEPYEVPEHIEPEHFEPDHFEPEHFEQGHFEPERFEEPLTDLEALGYHDSTAPHPHPHREHAQHPGMAAEHGLEDEHLPTEEQQPRRRFLRRTRPASLAEPQHAAHDEPQGAGPQSPREGGSMQEARESTAPPTVAGPPPPLEFNHPPKRPRFTAEPPAAPPPTQAAPAEHREPEPETEPEPESEHPAAQPTTEFDVQQHLRDAPHHDEPAQQHEPAQQDEDMLEETPEFLQDTPEHDRLWFEQRPPRDFDFDG